MTEREKLINQLKMIVINEWNSEMNIHCPNYETLADFILADRKRIVEPLIACSKIPNTLRTDRDWPYAAKLTLQNAGLTPLGG